MQPSNSPTTTSFSPRITNTLTVTPGTVNGTGPNIDWIAAPAVVVVLVLAVVTAVLLCVIVRKFNQKRMRIQPYNSNGVGASHDAQASSTTTTLENGDISDLLQDISVTPPGEGMSSAGWTYDDISLLNQYASQGDHEVFIVRQSPGYHVDRHGATRTVADSEPVRGQSRASLHSNQSGGHVRKTVTFNPVDEFSFADF